MNTITTYLTLIGLWLLTLLASLVFIVDLRTTFTLSLIMTLFFGIPGTCITMIFKEMTALERVTCSFLFGLSYGSIYFILDVVFRIPLTRTVFILTTSIVILASLLIAFKVRQKETAVNH